MAIMLVLGVDEGKAILNNMPENFVEAGLLIVTVTLAMSIDMSVVGGKGYKKG